MEIRRIHIRIQKKNLLEQELDLLEQEYALEGGEVRWRELAYLVDGGNEHLEQQPLPPKN